MELEGLTLQARELVKAHRAGLEARFSEALRLVWMAYQPIVSWNDRRVFGYEALLRTSEPTLASPAELLDAAERLGRLPELGRTIRRRVAQEASDAPPHVHFFVNLHPADLNDDELYAEASPLGRIADRVVLEVTERAPLDVVKNVDERMSQLRTRQFRVAVDDLGAGYAGLTSFTLLDPTIVKLDMSLVRGVDADPRKRSIIRAMAQLCSELGILVLAEGVETSAERETLAGLGCDLFQGFLFGRPGRGFANPVF
jgi:EAL domain-containing protein (putative c-di-GMP-specific phosphodiesterase class I)